MAAKAAPKVLSIESGQPKDTGFSAWRKGEDVVDALPYVDSLPPEAKRIVDRLIEEEVRRSTKKPSDYLREMPPMPPTTLDAHPLLAAEYERCEICMYCRRKQCVHWHTMHACMHAHLARQSAFEGGGGLNVGAKLVCPRGM